MTDSVAPLALELRGISKRFGALQANADISLQLRSGEVLALLGENGAGKSTLVSILFGHYRADSGEVRVFGHTLPPGQPRAALAAGVGMVHQHFTLADNLSVLDNVLLGTEPLWRPFSRRAAMRAKLLDTAQRFGLAVDPDARVADLGVGERQRVEILKALVRGARILILDEPTAVLTPAESESLFATLQQMVAQGLAIVFISHKLAEVLRVSHRVAVLRAGRLVLETAAGQTTAAELAQAMVGHQVALPQRQPAGALGAQVVSLQGVHTAPRGTAAGSPREQLRGVSLTLWAGEIAAIAGVSGNGQGALADVLSGAVRPARGQITWGHVDDGGQHTPYPTQARALTVAGVARIPEDRRAVGLVGDLAVWENAALDRLHTRAFVRHGWVRRAAARAHAQALVAEFDVRGGAQADVRDTPARALSGGNMQKLILGRALRSPDSTHAVPRFIVAHQPTWGLDVRAVAFIHQQLLAARDAGAAVLLISDDLDEVLALGDRIAVMHAGHLTEALPHGHWSRERIGLAMAGQASAQH